MEDEFDDDVVYREDDLPDDMSPTVVLPPLSESPASLPSGMPVGRTATIGDDDDEEPYDLSATVVSPATISTTTKTKTPASAAVPPPPSSSSAVSKPSSTASVTTATVTTTTTTKSSTSTSSATSSSTAAAAPPSSSSLSSKADKADKADPSGQLHIVDTSNTITSAPQAATAAAAMTYLGPPAYQKEVEIVTTALKEDFPQWQKRLDVAFGRHTPLRCDFNAMLAPCTTSEARLQAVTTLLQPTGLVSRSPPAVESLVKSLEEACAAPSARDIMAAKIQEIHIVSSVIVTRSGKTLQFTPGPPSILLYAGQFEKGSTGAFSLAEMREFLDMNFRIQERSLLAAFNSADGILASAQQRLNTALGKDTPLIFDLSSVLSACENQANRLRVAQLVCHEVGISHTVRRATNAAKDYVSKAMIRLLARPSSQQQQLEEGGASAASSAAEGESAETFVQPLQMTSPHVITPFLMVIEALTQDAENKEILAKHIGSVQFRLMPGRSAASKSLSLHKDLNSPPFSPANFRSQDPPQDCVLLYSGCFEAGDKGCINKDELNQFFETYFRCKERAMINQFLRSAVPSAYARLKDILKHGVTFEFVWTSIFPPWLEYDSFQRLSIAETLCARDSEFVLMPIVQAFADMTTKEPDTVRLFAHINRIIIQGVPNRATMMVSLINTEDKDRTSAATAAAAAAGAAGGGGGSAEDGLTLQSAFSQQQLQQIQQQRMSDSVTSFTKDGNALLFNVALTYGARGCHDFSAVKTAVRSIFNIPTPAEDQTWAATGRKIEDETKKFNDDVKRVGKAIAKKLSGL